MNLLITNVILSLFISLALHEFAHYLAARICKIPVTQAGLGWGPRLLSARVNKVDCHLRLLPLGAYVQMDMTVLQSRPLLQQLFVLGAGVAVNLALSGLAWGTLFGALNLALAIGNTLPLYQYDGWKVGMVISRRIFGRPNPLVEWTFTLAGGLFGLAVIALAVLSFYAPK
jgi:regulator of sigma E protease